jgi:hypothetical protein
MNSPIFMSTSRTVDRARDVGVALARQQRRRERDFVRPVAFAREAGLSRVHFGQSLHHDGQVGAHDGFIEPHHDVAGAHPAALAHQQLADNAAGQVLHLLHVGIDDNRAGRDHRARELGGCRPATEASGQHERDDRAAEEMTAERRSFVRQLARCHAITRQLGERS